MEQNCKNLIEAVKQDDIICVVRLLKEGEDPNVRNEFGKMPPSSSGRTRGARGPGEL